MPRKRGHLTRAGHGMHGGAADGALLAHLRRLPTPSYLFRRTDDDFELVEFNGTCESFIPELTAGGVGQPAGGLLQGRPALLEDLARCWREQQPVQRTTSMRVSGVLRTAHLTCVPVPPDLVVIHAQDLTASEATQAALARSEETYRTLVEGSIQGITIYQDDGIVFANRAAAGLTGRSVDELLALRPDQLPSLVHPDDRDMLVRRIEALRQGRAAPARGQYRALRKDGGVRWIESMVWPVDYGGRPALMSVAVDVTDQRQATEALQASEERYRMLVESALYGIYRSTIDGRLLEANPALVAMLGYASEAELLSVDLARDVYQDPGERARLIHQYRDAVRMEGVEAGWKRKDGTPITVRLSGRAVRDRSGAVTEYEMIVEDVTAQRALEDQFRQAQKMEAIGQLAGGVAHDFNNLLTAILGSADLLALDLRPGDPRRDDVLAIREAGERAAALTRQLLAFGRRQMLQPRVIDLNDVLAGMEKLLPRVIGENIRLEVRPGQGLARVSADPGQIEQVILNLVVNARDAMPEGGHLLVETANAVVDAAFALRHAAILPGAYVRLSVTDTGHGMDEATRERIFEPFFTTKEPGKGTGLGLATAYGIVKQSGGYIWVRSHPGRGTTFDIYLPPIDRPPDLSRQAVDVAGARPGSETILLVEDDVRVRGLARRALERYGYRVLEAANGWEALGVARAHEGAIDLMLTDVVMPEMGGRRSAEHVLVARPGIKVLYMSGHPGPDHPDGAGDVVQKPFTPESLARRVREVLDRS